MNGRFPSLFIVCIPLAASCLQKLDSGLASGGAQAVAGDLPRCDAQHGFACNFAVELTTPEIGLDHDPETGDLLERAPADQACAKVEKDTLGVLQNKCGACHQGGDNSPGFPLTFILNVQQLMSASSSSRFSGTPYIMPGNPDGSLIYQRAVLRKDMPRQDPLSPPSFLTVSEASNLRQWILACVPGAPQSGGGAGTASTLGTGGGPGGGPGSAGGNGALAGASSGGAAANGGAATVGASNNGGAGGSAGEDRGGAGAGGRGFTRPPCGGLCQGAVTFTTPPTYQVNELGVDAACYQTRSALTSFSCGNAQGRAFSINGMNVNCAAPLHPDTIPLHNGGYCIQATAGGSQSAHFTAL